MKRRPVLPVLLLAAVGAGCGGDQDALDQATPPSASPAPPPPAQLSEEALASLVEAVAGQVVGQLEERAESRSQRELEARRARLSRLSAEAERVASQDDAPGTLGSGDWGSGDWGGGWAGDGSDAEIEALLADAAVGRDRAWRGLIALDDLAAPALAERLLDEPSWPVGRSAWPSRLAQALIQIGGEDARQALQAALVLGSPSARQAVVEAVDLVAAQGALARDQGVLETAAQRALLVQALELEGVAAVAPLDPDDSDVSDDPGADAEQVAAFRLREAALSRLIVLADPGLVGEVTPAARAGSPVALGWLASERPADVAAFLAEAQAPAVQVVAGVALVEALGRRVDEDPGAVIPPGTLDAVAGACEQEALRIPLLRALAQAPALLDRALAAELGRQLETQALIVLERAPAPEPAQPLALPEPVVSQPALSQPADSDEAVTSTPLSERQVATVVLTRVGGRAALLRLLEGAGPEVLALLDSLLARLGPDDLTPLLAAGRARAEPAAVLDVARVGVRLAARLSATPGLAEAAELAKSLADFAGAVAPALRGQVGEIVAHGCPPALLAQPPLRPLVARFLAAEHVYLRELEPPPLPSLVVAPEPEPEFEQILDPGPALASLVEADDPAQLSALLGFLARCEPAPPELAELIASDPPRAAREQLLGRLNAQAREVWTLLAARHPEQASECVAERLSADNEPALRSAAGRVVATLPEPLLLLERVEREGQALDTTLVERAVSGLVEREGLPVSRFLVRVYSQLEDPQLKRQVLSRWREELLPEALGVIGEALEDNHRDVRTAARNYLRSLRDRRDLRELYADLQAGRDLPHDARAARDELLAMLDSQDPALVEAAIFSLGELGDPTVLPLLARRLAKAKGDERSRLEAAIRRIGESARR